MLEYRGYVNTHTCTHMYKSGAVSELVRPQLDLLADEQQQCVSNHPVRRLQVELSVWQGSQHLMTELCSGLQSLLISHVAQEGSQDVKPPSLLPLSTQFEGSPLTRLQGRAQRVYPNEITCHNGQRRKAQTKDRAIKPSVAFVNAVRDVASNAAEVR